MSHSCSSPFPNSWIFRLFTFLSPYLNKTMLRQTRIQFVREEVSISTWKPPTSVSSEHHCGYHLAQPDAGLGYLMHSAPGSHLLFHLPCQQHNHSVINQTPQHHDLATSVLHFIFKFSPQAAKPHTKWPGPLSNSLPLVSAPAFAPDLALWTSQRSPSSVSQSFAALSSIGITVSCPWVHICIK